MGTRGSYVYIASGKLYYLTILIFLQIKRYAGYCPSKNQLGLLVNTN